MPTAQQQAWSNELEKGRNNASRASNQPEGADAPPTDGLTVGIQTFTLQISRMLVTAAIPTFGLTWILLTFYTLFKDLIGLRFLADPGDVVFVFLPPKAIAALPESVKSVPRLMSRIFIYPIGILLMAAYGILVVIVIALINALVDPVGVAAKLLGIVD